MGIHHANDREPVERAVNTASCIQSRCLLTNLLLTMHYFPVILEHKRVRGRGQRGDPAEESLDP